MNPNIWYERFPRKARCGAYANVRRHEVTDGGITSLHRAKVIIIIIIIVSRLKNTQWTHFKKPAHCGCAITTPGLLQGERNHVNSVSLLLKFWTVWRHSRASRCSQRRRSPLTQPSVLYYAGVTPKPDYKTHWKKIYVCGSDFASFWPLQRQTSERTISAPTGFPLSRLLLMSISNITPVRSSICSSSRECYFVRPCMKEMCFFSFFFFPFQISLWAYFLFLCTFKFSLNRSGTKRQAQRFLVN